MTLEVAIIGAGIVGMTNAVYLLEKGFKVTVFTKDYPLKTTSDTAAATWYAPDDTKPILQKLCLESLSMFNDISKIQNSGVLRTSAIHYFKDEADFAKSVWATETLKNLLNIRDKLPEDYVKNENYQKVVLMDALLIDTNIYRPLMLDKFIESGGKLEIKEIDSLKQLTNSHDIVLNCAGWESKYLANDDSVYPVRGQVEIAKINDDLKNSCSFNVRDIDTYVVFRPASKDCVMGTTYQVNMTAKEASSIDKISIINKVTPFFQKAATMETTSKVGVRCGRADVRIESNVVYNSQGKKALLIHCYGHGGSGFSASWGSAYKVLEHCMSYKNEINQRYMAKL